MKARGKMQVKKVSRTMYGGDEVEMSCAYDPENPEDKAFSEATPSGNMNVRITNPALVGTFEPGEFYYIELHKAD